MKLPVIALFVSTALFALMSPGGHPNMLAELPEVRGAFTLTAMRDASTARNAFAYNGHDVPPLIRVAPGGSIVVHYVNNLPTHSDEACALGPCSNMSNLHFHGLHVSPDSPQDDVLTMMSMPGQTLNYKVDVPDYAPPGLYWYHTHPHGESNRQDLDGMSGAIVVDGIDRYYPDLRTMRERVLVLRDSDIEHAAAATRQRITQQVEIPPGRCGTATEQGQERVFSLNGDIRPLISMAPGGREFWRIVNASPDRYADLQIGGQPFEIVALDGMPLNYHNRARGTRKVDHYLLPPAGRLKAIVTSPSSDSRTTLRAHCVDTGLDGDDNPDMVVADIASTAPAAAGAHNLPATSGSAVYKDIADEKLQSLKAAAPDFTVIFSEDKDGFYINGKKFAMDAEPMLRVNIGSMQHWRVLNATRELHPFHIHQIHFLAYAENGKPSDSPEWLDTVNVPYGGTVDLIMDFTDPIIRGMSVFHCHLLNHEDKGMMAKILFQ